MFWDHYHRECSPTKVWVSATVLVRNSNGTYDVECAHGAREERVSMQWIRPRALGDNIEESAAGLAWTEQTQPAHVCVFVRTLHFVLRFVSVFVCWE